MYKKKNVRVTIRKLNQDTEAREEPALNHTRSGSRDTASTKHTSLCPPL